MAAFENKDFRLIDEAGEVLIGADDIDALLEAVWSIDTLPLRGLTDLRAVGRVEGAWQIFAIVDLDDGITVAFDPNEIVRRATDIGGGMDWLTVAPAPV